MDLARKKFTSIKESQIFFRFSNLVHCVMAHCGSGIKRHPKKVDLKRTLRKNKDEITMSSFLAVEEGLGREFSIVLHLPPNISQFL
jgi:hypothetical protein